MWPSASTSLLAHVNMAQISWKHMAHNATVYLEERRVKEGEGGGVKQRPCFHTWRHQQIQNRHNTSMSL
jgi:hypothetical protein